MRLTALALIVAGLAAVVSVATRHHDEGWTRHGPATGRARVEASLPLPGVAFAASEQPLEEAASGSPEGPGAPGFELGPEGRIRVPGDDFVEGLLQGASPQVSLGAERYHLVCAACHGTSGLGLEEGRSAFPPPDRSCERCHRPLNPPLISSLAIGPRNSFSIGAPPALRGSGVLDAFPTSTALAAYLRATMPRYEPGKLNDEEYAAVTAFLLVLDGRMPASDTLLVPGAPGDPPPWQPGGGP